MPRLGKRAIDKLKKDGTDRFVWDSDMPGFGVRILPSGIKSYLVQYRTGGRTRRYTLGSCATLTPEDARKLARAALGDVDKGGDPSLKRRQELRAPTVAALAERFLEQHAKQRCKASTLSDYRSIVNAVIKPELGTFKIGDVMRPDIARLHQKLKKKPYRANRVLAVLSKMFNLAELWGLRADGSNPCRLVPKYREEKRERYLSDKELKALGKALVDAERDGSEAKAAISAIRLLLFTGCRLREIQHLKWSYVGDGRIELPDSKTGKRTIHLSRAALAVLKGMERKPGEREDVLVNEYVFAGPKAGKPLADLRHPWMRLRDKAGLTGTRIHDLRHTFASVAVSNGETLPIVGKALGHTQPQTTARYAHVADNPVLAAVTRVSDRLEAALKGTAPKASRAATESP